MKAVILERRGDYAAVLCENGTFENRRVSGEVGETVELAAETIAFQPRKKNRWMRTAVAAALALSVTGGTLGYMGGTASAYVSLDVEDSAIELAVNHFGRVIAVNALSEDAEELAASLSGEVRHRKVEYALDHTMDRLRGEGFGENSAVIAGVASDNGRRKAELAKNLENAADGRMLVVTESSRAEREQAMEQKISVGRFGMTRDHVELPAAAEADKAKTREPVQQAEPAAPVSGTDSGIEAAETPPRNEGQPMQERPPQRESNAPSDAEIRQGAERPDNATEQPHQETIQQPVQPEEPSPQDGAQPGQTQEQAPQEREQSRPQQAPQMSEPPEQPQNSQSGDQQTPRENAEAPNDAERVPSQEQEGPADEEIPQESPSAPTARSDRQGDDRPEGGSRSEQEPGAGAPPHGRAEMGGVRGML